MFSFGVRLHRRGRVAKSWQRFAGGDDAPDGRQRGERAVEAAGIEDLRHQAAIGQRRRIAVAEGAGGRMSVEQLLDSQQARVHPVAIPGVLLLLGGGKMLAEILQDAQVVDGMDVAGDGLRQRPDPRPVLGRGRQQRRQRMDLVEIFDDRQRLGEGPVPGLQRRHGAERTQRAVGGLVLLAAVTQQMDRHRFIGQALQVERDAHPVGGGTAETGAGQHGVATATVCALKGVECIVYMGEKDIERQAPNVARMKMLGATVIPATSGSKTLKDATNEAIRDWINNPNDTHYIIGSVVGPHPYPDMVARFQSVISEEMRKQLLEKTGSELPTHVMACVGGGSNAAGAFYHFLDEPSVQLIAIEAAGEGVNSGKSAATTALGKPGILHGSKSLLMQTEDGQVVEPHSISAGLDYPGIGPLHAHLFKSGRGTFLSATDDEALQAAFELAKLEGIIPALETAHALAALKQMKFKKEDVVVICLSGRGDKDLSTYMKAL